MITKEWLESLDVDALKQALAEIQTELLRRPVSAWVSPRSGVSIASLSELAPARIEIGPDHIPTITELVKGAGVVMKALSVDEDDAGNVCYPYLLESVEISSCPVIGKEQLRGDPLDFDGMEI